MDVIKREEAKRVAKGGRHFRRTGSGRARDGAYIVGERGDARRIDRTKVETRVFLFAEGDT